MDKPEDVGAEDKRCRAVHSTDQDHEEKEVATQEIDVSRSNVFYFHSTRSVIIVRLKTKAVKKWIHVNKI